MADKKPKKVKNDEKVLGADDKKEIISPYKSKEYEAFALWLSLPPMLKGVLPEELTKKFMLDDEHIQNLCQIRNMGEFAQVYGVARETLSDWKKQADTSDIFIQIRKWTKKLTKNVVLSTYKSAMRANDPKAHNDRKLMLQMNGFNEESTVNVKGEGLFEILKKGLNIQ